jgi:hypothetical protein
MDTPETEKETTVEKIEGVLRDLVGLPPGDGTPHGQGRPTKAEDVPRGTLTSDDAEGLPPHAGTGIAVE